METQVRGGRSGGEVKAKLKNLKPALDRVASQTLKSAKVKSILVLANLDPSNQSDYASAQGIPSLHPSLPLSLTRHSEVDKLARTHSVGVMVLTTEGIRKLLGPTLEMAVAVFKNV